MNFSRNYTSSSVTWQKGNRQRTVLFSYSVGWNPASQPPHILLWDKSYEVGMARKRTCGTQASGVKPQVMHWISKLLLLTLGNSINPLYFLSLITDLLNQNTSGRKKSSLTHTGRKGWRSIVDPFKMHKPTFNMVHCDIFGAWGESVKGSTLAASCSLSSLGPKLHLLLWLCWDKGQSRESYPTFLTLPRGAVRSAWTSPGCVADLHKRIQLQAKTKMRSSSTRSLSPLWDNFK